jgi:hypothetical protein
MMTILAASTVLLALILKAIAGGWFVFLFVWFYLAIGVAHVVIHRKASQSIPQKRALAIVSNVLLLMAFLVQFDEGDGPCRWTTITGLLYGRGFEPCFNEAYFKQINSVLVDAIAFVPVAITWHFLLQKRGR